MAAAYPQEINTRLPIQLSSYTTLAATRQLMGTWPELTLREECPDWNALRVRPRWEKTVAAALLGKEYEAFVPLYTKRRQWSDRRKEVDLPLFPGYVFYRGDSVGRPRLVTTPGVIDILHFGGVPAIITDSEIETIKKAALSSGLCTEPWTYIREGQRVRVHTGALAGVEGVLIRTKTDCRLVLSVEAVCRSIAVEIDREYVAPL